MRALIVHWHVSTIGISAGGRHFHFIVHVPILGGREEDTKYEVEEYLLSARST